MGGMAMGLFCTLIAGTILRFLLAIIFGNAAGTGWAQPIHDFLFDIGGLAMMLMGAGIGAGVAHALGASKLVLFSAVAAGFIGAFAAPLASNFTQLTTVGGSTSVIALGSAGNPINSFICALVAVELSNLIVGKTKVDILAIPLLSILAAGITAVTVGRPVDWLIGQIGNGINWAADLSQGSNIAIVFFMSIIISVVMGLLLTLPTSSAAIGIAIGLSGPAAAAAVAGCCAHMVGFAAASFKDNGPKGIVPQGLGTSMLQIPNVFKKPIILLPAVTSSIVTGPLAVLVFGLHSSPVGSGMGTAGLVGVIETVRISWGQVGGSGTSVWQIVLGVAFVCFVLPAAISFFAAWFMRKRGWIKDGDMKLDLK
jgi:hypothetical protein